MKKKKNPQRQGQLSFIGWFPLRVRGSHRGVSSVQVLESALAARLQGTQSRRLGEKPSSQDSNEVLVGWTCLSLPSGHADVQCRLVVPGTSQCWSPPHVVCSLR